MTREEARTEIEEELKIFLEGTSLDDVEILEDKMKENAELRNVVEANRMAIQALEQTRWIPCSERMPEVSDHYLIQYSRHICRDEMAVAFYSVEEAELDKNYTWEFKPFGDCKEVIAWMPLPTPYKAESED